MKQARVRQDEQGFALLLVFVLAATIAITLYMELPRVAFESQRVREQLLVNRGNEYKRAIQLFYRKFKRFPAKIDELESTNNVRFLRQRYKDPMTGKDNWRLVHVGAGGMLTDSLVQKQNPLGGPGSSPFGNPLGGKDQKDQTADSSQQQQQPPPQLNVNGVEGGGGINLATARRPSDRMALGSGGTGAVPAGQYDPNQLPNPAAVPPPGYVAQYPPAKPPYPGQPDQTGQPADPNQQLNPQPSPGQTVYPSLPTGQLNPQPVVPGVVYPPGYPGAPSFPGQNGNPGQPVVPGQIVQPGQLPQFPPQPGQQVPPNPYAYPNGQQVPPNPYAYPNGQQVPPNPYAYPNGQQVPPNPYAYSNGQQVPPSQYPNPQPGQTATTNSQQTPGGFAAPPNAAVNAIQQQLFTARQPPTGAFGSTPNDQTGGVAIAGVASVYKGEGIKRVNERKKYEEWEFVYDLKKDKTVVGNLAGGIPGAQGGLPGNPGGGLGGTGTGGGGVGGAGGGLPPVPQFPGQPSIPGQPPVRQQ